MASEIREMEVHISRERGRVRITWSLRPDLWDPHDQGAWVSRTYRELKKQGLCGVIRLGPRDIRGTGFLRPDNPPLLELQDALALFFANTKPPVSVPRWKGPKRKPLKKKASQ